MIRPLGDVGTPNGCRTCQLQTDIICKCVNIGYGGASKRRVSCVGLTSDGYRACSAGTEIKLSKERTATM